MSEKDDLKKKFEKRSHDKSKRKPKEKKDKALVRTIGQYEVDFDQSLGKGQFGNVYRACIAANPQKVYACKHISEKRLSSDCTCGPMQTTTRKIRLERQSETG